jgi:hypothetical protein
MAFPVFAPGDVLNASDMNAVGLWLVGSAAFTTTTGFNLPNGSFSSTYTNYRLMIRITSVAVDADFTGRMRASGTNNTDNQYSVGFAGFTNGNAASNFGGATTSFTLGESDTDARVAMWWDIFNPATTDKTAIFGQICYLDKANTATFFRNGGGFHNVASAFDSFAFISSQNVTGRYWLYGYRDA